MTVRPVDDDLLADICRSIAQDNYGFLYVSEVSSQIQSEYEAAETGLLNAGSISGSEIKQTLQSIAGQEISELQQLRTGVYYVDPFGAAGGERLTSELTNLFGQRLVVTSETLRSRFNLAIDDIDYFTGELENRDLVSRITAGEQDYFTIGPRLKEHAGEANVDSQLRRQAEHGIISHDKLESVIDVAATTDVIRYLAREGFIIDLSGEYLVRSDIDSYGRYVADEIEYLVEEAFEDSQYVLPTSEVETVIENAIDDHFDVLSRVGRGTADDVRDAVRSALDESLGLVEDRNVVVRSDELADHAAAEAERIKEIVERESDPLPGTPSGYEEAAEDEISNLTPTATPTVNQYIREEIRTEYADLVRSEEFQVES